MRVLFSVGSGHPKLQEIMWLGQITRYQRAVLLVSQARFRFDEFIKKSSVLQYSPAALYVTLKLLLRWPIMKVFGLMRKACACDANW